MPKAVRWHQKQLQLCLGFHVQKITLQKTVASMVSPKSPMVQKSYTYYYFIEVDGTIVGAIRVVDRKDDSIAKRISPIFIMKEYRGHGYAQRAIQLAEVIHGVSNWELDTILQEKANCYLYEKMEYRQTGLPKVINERMTIIFYHKD